MVTVFFVNAIYNTLFLLFNSFSKKRQSILEQLLHDWFQGTIPIAIALIIFALGRMRVLFEVLMSTLWVTDAGQKTSTATASGAPGTASTTGCSKIRCLATKTIIIRCSKKRMIKRNIEKCRKK